MQARERQRCLDLEALCPQDQCLTCLLDELLEEGRLADTGFTVHDQAGRRPVPSLLEKSGQVCALEVAAD